MPVNDSDIERLRELDREIKAQHSNLKYFKELMDRHLSEDLDDFASCLSYASCLNHYYSVIAEIKDMEYERLDIFCAAVGMDATGNKRLSEIENRILQEYWKRLDGIPSHTMGVEDCPDCKIPLSLHAYHCHCCGWHDKDKEEEVMKMWDDRKEQFFLERGIKDD